MAVEVRYPHGTSHVSRVFKEAIGYVSVEGQLQLHRNNEDGQSEPYMLWAEGSWLSAELLEDDDDSK